MGSVEDLVYRDASVRAEELLAQIVDKFDVLDRPLGRNTATHARTD